MNTRRLIAHGPSSLTIALPHKWVKKHHLQKGDSVSVNEELEGLRVTAQPSERKIAISVSIAGHDWPSTISVLTTVYRRGYDELTVRYETPEEYQNISTAIHSLLGFAIIDNRKGTCIVKSLPTQLEQDFPALFRRVFLILLQQIDDLSDIIKSPELVKTFYRRDADVNTIVNLALRMINKGYINDHFQELHLFHALLIMEECGDDLTRFSIEIQQYQEAHKLKEAVQQCSQLLRLLYDGYFQKKIGVMAFYKQYYLYWPGEKKKSAPLYEFFAAKSKEKPIFYLRSIIEKIIQLAEILLLPQEQFNP